MMMMIVVLQLCNLQLYHLYLENFHLNLIKI